METLVAISILLVITSGVMLLVNQVTQSSTKVTNRLTASYLASDAIEYLRSSRDTYWLSGDSLSDWFGDTLNNCTSSKCIVDTRIAPNDKVEQCDPVGGCDRLRVDANDSNRYGHDESSWEKSVFTRSLKATSTDHDGNAGPEEVIITVTVSWSSASGNSSLTVTDSLTAWGD